MMDKNRKIPGAYKGDEKTLLLYLHIPKTGGSSLRAVLERQYSADEIIEINPRSQASDRKSLEQQGTGALGGFGFKKMNPSDVYNFAAFADQPGSRAVAGHFPFGIHAFTERPCKYITLLRKPEKLIVSLYHEMFLSDDPFDVQLAGKFGGLKTFAEQVHNVQTFILSGLTEYRDMLDAPDHALSLALKNAAEHFLFIGRLEHFSASLKRAGKLAGWENPYSIPRLKQGAYNIQNAGNDLANLLTERNALDTALYAFAEKNFKLHRFAILR